MAVKVTDKDKKIRILPETAEVGARIKEKIAEETVRATSAEDQLSSNLSLEIDRAIEAESALSRDLASEISRATSKEDELGSALSSEIGRATTEEARLSQSIVSESDRARSVEATLQSDISAEKDRAISAEDALSDRVSEIERAVPDQVSSDNLLADRRWTQEQINQLTAYYRGSFETKALLDAWQSENPDIANNADYAYVQSDETHSGQAWRYIFVQEPGEAGSWQEQYKINDAPFTSEQLDAINSGATKTKIDSISSKLNRLTPEDSGDWVYSTYGADSEKLIKVVSDSAAPDSLVQRTGDGAIFTGSPVDDNHATPKSYVDSEVSSRYLKPDSGIPESDLSAEVGQKLNRETMSVDEGTAGSLGTARFMSAANLKQIILYHSPSGSRPPNGSAGGDLSGSYPNPSLISVTRKDTESAASLAFGDSFISLDSVTTDSKGRVTGVSKKTLTLPRIEDVGFAKQNGSYETLKAGSLTTPNWKGNGSGTSQVAYYRLATYKLDANWREAHGRFEFIDPNYVNNAQKLAGVELRVAASSNTIASNCYLLYGSKDVLGKIYLSYPTGTLTYPATVELYYAVNGNYYEIVPKLLYNAIRSGEDGWVVPDNNQFVEALPSDRTNVALSALSGYAEITEASHAKDADNATNDGEGNNIPATYAKQDGDYETLGAGYLSREQSFNNNTVLGWANVGAFTIQSSDVNHQYSCMFLVNGTQHIQGADRAEPSGLLELDFDGSSTAALTILAGNLNPDDYCVVVTDTEVILYHNMSGTYNTTQFVINAEKQYGKSVVESMRFAFADNVTYGQSAPSGAVYATIRNEASGAQYISKRSFLNGHDTGAGWYKIMDFSCSSTGYDVYSCILLVNGVYNTQNVETVEGGKAPSGLLEIDLRAGTGGANGQIAPGESCLSILAGNLHTDSLALTFSGQTASLYIRHYTAIPQYQFVVLGERGEYENTWVSAFTSEFIGTSAPSGAEYAVVRNVASRLGTADVGNSTTPVWIDNGVAKAVSVLDQTTGSPVPYEDIASRTKLVTMNTIAYWNGAYSDAGASNLRYCRNGEIVSTGGAQTISGAKTFSVAPKISASLSSTLDSTDVATTAWVRKATGNTALTAADADKLGGKPASEYVTTNSEQTITAVKTFDGGIETDEIKFSSGTHGKVYGQSETISAPSSSQFQGIRIQAGTNGDYIGVTTNQHVTKTHAPDPVGLGDDEIVTTGYLENYLKTIYPVGSIYISYNTTSPASLFGGSWTPIATGRFLRATTGSTGGTGGATSVVLEQRNLPDLSNLLGVKTTGMGSGQSPDEEMGGVNSGVTWANVQWTDGANVIMDRRATGDINNVSIAAAFDITPTYVNVRMWRRTA